MSDLRKAHEVLYPGTLDRLALDLACAYEPDAVVVSWEAQQRAQDYVNTHSLYEALGELARLTEIKHKEDQLAQIRKVLT